MMSIDLDFEAKIKCIDDLIWMIEALPANVTCLRMSAGKVYSLLAEPGKQTAYLAAEISDFGRRLVMDGDVARFERAAPGWTKIMPPVKDLA